MYIFILLTQLLQERRRRSSDASDAAPAKASDCPAGGHLQGEITALKAQLEDREWELHQKAGQLIISRAYSSHFDGKLLNAPFSCLLQLQNGSYTAWQHFIAPYTCKSSTSASIICHLQRFMSHSLLWRYIVLLTVGVYSSNHRVLYIIGISLTRNFKKVRSVRPSVRL